MSSNGTNGVTDGASEYVIPLQIDGNDVKTKDTFNVVNPATGKVIWKCSSASKDDAIKAAEAAQAAFPTWAKTKPSERRDLFLRAADILEHRGEELGQYMKDETGALPAVVGGFNIPTSVEMLRDVAGRIVTAIAGSVPICGQEGTSAILYKEPYGVVLGIAPW